MNNIILVGTAHISKKSIENVRETIEREKPDVVAVELCSARYHALCGEAKEISMRDALKGGRLYFFLAQWLMAYVQKKLGADVGVEPGAEMMAAVDAANANGAKVALVDRDLQITLQRFWGMMKFREKIKMVFALFGALFAKGEDIDLEKITEQDVVTELVKELRKFSPGAARVLIDERDAYIAGNLLQLAKEHKKIVAVVGAGHVEGVNKYLQQPESIPELEGLRVVKRRRFGIGKAIGFVFLAMMLWIFISIIAALGINAFLVSFGYWILITGILAAAGAAVARAHPLSIATAFGVAWMTTLHPLLAAGWFSGLVEARVRNPSAKDFRTLMDAESLRDLMKNNLFRVLLVAAITNVGAMIGFFLGIYVILNITGINLKTAIFGVLHF